MKTVFEWRIEAWHSTILMQVSHVSILPRNIKSLRNEHIEIVFGTDAFIDPPALSLPYNTGDDSHRKLVTKDFGTPDKAQQFLTQARSAVRQCVKECYPVDRVFIESDGHTDTFLVTEHGEVPDSGAEEL